VTMTAPALFIEIAYEWWMIAALVLIAPRLTARAVRASYRNPWFALRRAARIVPLVAATILGWRFDGFLGALLYPGCVVAGVAFFKLLLRGLRERDPRPSIWQFKEKRRIRRAV